MRRSTTKGAAKDDGVVKGSSTDWELRPGGMLVQKRQPVESSSSPMIKTKVSHGSYHHEVTVPAQSTFGKHMIIICIFFLFGGGGHFSHLLFLIQFS